MERFLNRYLLGAGMLVLAVPAATLAQSDKAQKEQEAAQLKAEKEQLKAEKAQWKAEKEKQKAAERIIITRTGDRNEKTVIEINGDNVIVNGKNAKDLKGDVRVQRHRLRDVDALVAAPPAPPAPPRAGTSFNFNLDDDGMMFFSQDSTRAMLGVMTAEDERGARINSVSKESGAEKAGLKAGDVITRIDDEKIEDAGDVTEVVRQHKPGDKVTITYLRGGKEQKTTATLTPWKGLRINADGDNFRVLVPGRVAPFGPNGRFEFRDFNMEIPGGRPKLGISIQDREEGKGVSVEDVEEESAAAKAGIREGDIITHFNDTAVDDVNDMRRELAANRDKASAKIKLLRNGKEQMVEVKMPRKLKSADL